MRLIDGCVVQDGCLSFVQKQFVDAMVMLSMETNLASYVYEFDNAKYLITLDSSLSIWGFGENKNPDTQRGVIWGTNTETLLHLMYYAQIKNFWPYKVEPNTLYLIKSDGMNYVSNHYKKDVVVDTPRGRGTIVALNEFVMVESQQDPKISWAFNYNDLPLLTIPDASIEKEEDEQLPLP